MAKKERDLQKHVSVLGWLFIIGGGIILMIGLILFFFLAIISVLAGLDGGGLEALATLLAIGTAGLFLLAILASLGLLVGYGLLKRKPWARTVAIVLGILELFNFPIGTAIGIYTLWVLIPEDAAVYFDEREARASQNPKN